MNIKKILTGVVALALVAAISVGATLAYLTDTKSVKNTFTVGNVGIELTETFTQNTKLIPGHTFTKEPVLKVSTGSEDCYLRVKVTIPAKMEAVLESIPAALTGWTRTKVGNTYFYTKTDKASADNTFTLFSSLKVKSNIDKTLFTGWTEADKEMNIIAEAIQAQEFADAAAAWAAYEAPVNP